jgi:hypothetical protein
MRQLYTYLTGSSRAWCSPAFFLLGASTCFLLLSALDRHRPELATRSEVPDLAIWPTSLNPAEIVGVVEVVSTDLYDDSGEVFAHKDFGLSVLVSMLPAKRPIELESLRKATCNLRDYPQDLPKRVPSHGCVFYHDSEETSERKCTAVFWGENGSGWACAVQALSDRVFLFRGEYKHASGGLLTLLNKLYPKSPE